MSQYIDIQLKTQNGQSWQRIGPGFHPTDSNCWIYAFRRQGDWEKVNDGQTVVIGLRNGSLNLSYDNEITEDLKIICNDVLFDLKHTIVPKEYFVSGSGMSKSIQMPNSSNPVATVPLLVIRSKKLGSYIEMCLDGMRAVQDEVKAGYVIMPQYIQGVIEQLEKQNEYFKNMDECQPSIAELNNYFANDLTSGGYVASLSPVYRSYQTNYEINQGPVEGHGRVLVHQNVMPARLGQDGGLMNMGEKPQGNYAGGGIVEVVPNNNDRLPVFYFAPLANHGLVAFIGNKTKTRSIVVAKPNGEIITYGAPIHGAFAVTKNTLVGQMGKAGGVLQMAKDDACKICPQPCESKTECNSGPTLNL